MDQSRSEAVASGQDLALASGSSLADLAEAGRADIPDAREASQPGVGTETIDLGGSRFLDELNAPLVAARPKPRGLLPVPPEVEAAVTEDDSLLLKQHGIVPTAEARRRQVNSLTLQFYYSGHDVAYRLTPQGVELLAAGLSEIRQLVQGMGQEELMTIKIGQP